MHRPIRLSKHRGSKPTAKKAGTVISMPTTRYFPYPTGMGQVSKVVEAGVQTCNYPAAPPFYIMAVLSGTHIVRVLCVCVANPYCVAVCVCWGCGRVCSGASNGPW